MYTIFVEYKIEPDKRERYMKHMASIPAEVARRGGIGYRWLEGVEQPNTFVEAFETENLNVYQEIRKWRMADTTLQECVKGGAAKIHMWAFQPQFTERNTHHG